MWTLSAAVGADDGVGGHAHGCERGSQHGLVCVGVRSGRTFFGAKGLPGYPSTRTHFL